MTITLNEQDGRLVATLVGELNTAASSEADRCLKPLFERTDCDFVLDCSSLTYISSSGLRIVLNVFKHARSTGHHAVLRGLSDNVHEIFAISGFLQLFDIEQEP